ncbi:hypothetical protein BKA69DRAFT_1042776 [Paraphysoderma sedebokerense]|nr:hypothetical protein BKA69DRAFT_1042776 [Paraphysoderma sedebokerense]
MSYIDSDVDTSTFSSHSISVSGINLKVHGLNELKNLIFSFSAVVILMIPNSTIEFLTDYNYLYGFLPHLGTQEDMKPLSNTIVSHIHSHAFPCTFPILTVTLDHRNHGSRLTDVTQNHGWKEKDILSNTDLLNPNHATDMYCIQLGTALDVLLLIDLLPLYLQTLVRKVASHATTAIKWKWGVVGVSLGGHSTLLAVFNGRVAPLLSCMEA